MTASDTAIRFVPFEAGSDDHRSTVLSLTGEYFAWMNDEITTACGFSIPDLVGQGLDRYVASTMDTMCASRPPVGAFYIAERSGEAVGMGGLRRLPDGDAEIVRIYTRPEHRGLGIGARTVAMLVEEARRFGYRRLKLDTGVFMTSAHRIYAAAGFTVIDPYDGAEPPAALHPFWLYMQRTL